MTTSNKHIYNIPNDIFIYILNPFLDSTSKFRLYTTSKHLSSLIPLTTIDSFTYNRKTNKLPTPNIFKHQNSYTFKVEKIIFEHAYKNIEFNLPASVKEIIYLAGFAFPNYVCDIAFPNISNSSITTLIFMQKANILNHSLKGLLPKTLKYLHLPRHFNRKLNPGDLPDGLQELIMSDMYTHEIIPGVFPASLKSLTFYSRQSLHTVVSGIFPENLEHLTIDCKYNGHIHVHIIEKNYPQKLLSLELLNNFSDVIDVSKLPRTLETLILEDCDIKQFTQGMLPPNLKKFVIGKYESLPFDKSMFPAFIEEIILIYWKLHEITKDTFPESLKILNLGCYNHCITNLPSQLEELHLSNYSLEFDLKLLPKTLKKLYFGPEWDYCVPPESLPTNLEVLHFSGGFNHSLSNVLVHCTKLKTLDLGVIFDRVILPGMLPSSLKHLTFSYAYNQPLDIKSLPENLHTLIMGESFDHPILHGVLPKSLRKLQLGGFFQQKLNNVALNEGLETFIISNPDSCISLQDLVLPTSINYFKVGNVVVLQKLNA
jgi:hypothetical protein